MARRLVTSCSLLLVVYLVNTVKGLEDFAVKRFPDNFKFGVATASYQIEGGWNASDKSESIWDRMTHRYPDSIFDKSNGDIACDSYNLYKRDVEMCKELNVDFYRFSISWSRLLPTGFPNHISEDGARYYNALINELLNNGIEPVVTLYHWDLPQTLQDIGGWPNSNMADIFEDYARVAFTLFGDRVKTWLTFNEPQVFCVQGYGMNKKAPMLNMPGIAEYMCGHTMLRAHAKAYRLYDSQFKAEQKGQVGLTLSASYQRPATDSIKDKEAAVRYKAFELEWFSHPIFSQEGNYPQIMIDRIGNISAEQGFARSRLPEFSQKDLDDIKGSFDFFGLNHYTTGIVKNLENVSKSPSYWFDMGANPVSNSTDPTAASSWLKVVPWGFRKILNLIKENYGNVEIRVFENGYSDFNGTNDVDRINYLRDYMSSLLDAMADGCNVTAYTVWSLMDNFEWARGYSERFGLYYIDYNTPDRKRVPKDSARYYKEVIKTRTLNVN